MRRAEIERRQAELREQWPLIGRWLHVTDSGCIESRHHWFACLPNAERTAAAYEEWARFYEWKLEQRATELARDRGLRNLVRTWTDSMAYSCRRSAAFARGDDPGEWISQRERRPDLAAESAAIVAEIVAELDGPPDRVATVRQLVGTGAA